MAGMSDFIFFTGGAFGPCGGPFKEQNSVEGICESSTRKMWPSVSAFCVIRHSFQQCAL